jgi:GGDEF domain-containing protein
MTTQNEIRQAFARQWDQPSQAGNNAWVIKGDFDHFKLTNDLYGALITDYLLDWTIEVIETVLKRHQSQWGCGELLCNVVGDDVTLYIPPSRLGEDEIRRLLWKIRAAIQESFWQRYLVGVLPLPADFFEDVAPDGLQRLRDELDRMEVVLDFAARRSGFLFLFPAGRNGQALSSLDAVLRTLGMRASKPVPAVDVQLNWICDPDERAGYTFNQGYLDPPQVSFAACPIRMAQAGTPGREDSLGVFERISTACQAALRQCKQQRKGVCLRMDGDALQDVFARPSGLPGSVSARQLRWSTERRLREHLYFRRLDQAVLFQFNPVYTLSSGMPADILHNEKYRGNQYGVGLKGINELAGRSAADRVIAQLLSIFSGEISSVLARKGIPPEQVLTAQFVDRLTVCCERPVFHLPDILALIRGVAAQFNAVEDEIKISQLRASVVLGDTGMPGYCLFNQLILTSLSARSACLVKTDPHIEVRQNCQDALQEGRAALERNTYASARQLAAYSRGGLYT